MNTSQVEKQQDWVIDPLLKAAAYALYWGDLECCASLAKGYTEEFPCSGSAYALLALAHGGKSDWIGAATAARIAFCLGIRDPQLCGLLAGLYRSIKHTEEAEWIEEAYGGSALLLQVSTDLHVHLKQLLTQHISPPKRQVPLKNQASLELPMMSVNAHDKSQLPDWMEGDQLSGWEEESAQASLPEWLMGGVEGLDEFSLELGELPDWIENGVHLEWESLSAPTSQVKTQYQTNLQRDAQAVKNAIELAVALGLGDQFTMTAHLNSLVLEQENKPPREVKGPLLMCLDREKLIIATYEETTLKQRPWAFTSSQVKRIKQRVSGVTIDLEEGRSLFLNVGSQSVVLQLTQALNEWFHSA